jgi:hypothetical protein
MSTPLFLGTIVEHPDLPLKAKSLDLRIPNHTSTLCEAYHYTFKGRRTDHHVDPLIDIPAFIAVAKKFNATETWIEAFRHHLLDAHVSLLLCLTPNVEHLRLEFLAQARAFSHRRFSRRRPGKMRRA